MGVASGVGGNQLTALLGPGIAAAGIDPYRPDAGIVISPSHDGGVAVRRQRDRVALVGGSNRVGADELAALLAPDPTAAAGEDPHRPDVGIVAPSPHDGGVAG